MCVIDYNLKKYVILTDFYKKKCTLDYYLEKKMYEIKILLYYCTYLLIK